MARTYVPDVGDIVWISFNPQTVHEQAGHRPAGCAEPRCVQREDESHGLLPEVLAIHLAEPPARAQAVEFTKHSGHTQKFECIRVGEGTGSHDPRLRIPLVNVVGIEAVTPCLQGRAGKTLNALSGVAYTETDKIFALSNVPKLSQTRPKEQRWIAKLTANSSRSGLFPNSYLP